MENHHLRCSATAPRNPLANITPPQEDQEAIPTGHAPDPATDPIAAATRPPHYWMNNSPSWEKSSP